LRRLFKRIFGKRKAKEVSSVSDALLIDIENRGGGLVSVNMDRFLEREQQELCAEFLKTSGFIVFEGCVEHAYDMAGVSDPGLCPRCNAQTEQQYANFIYATQIATRVMFVPAGYFCTECPSVVIDQEMIRCAMADRRYGFQGVLGIDYMGKREPDIFQTWNEKEAIYIFDEDQRPQGIATANAALSHIHAPPNTPKRRRRKEKQQRKMRKQSRRRN